MARRLTVRALAFLLAPALFSLPLPAGEAPDLLAWPGKPHPRPMQRDLNEVEAIPTHEDDCPVCGFAIAVPEPDKLMHRTTDGESRPVWEMHVMEQDADMCPHPGPHKLDYQADILVCPSCGLAAKVDDFFTLVNPGFRAWTLERLRPSIRAAERRLLGKRGADMTDEECAAFFNRQEEIPDRLRTEHARTVYAALRADKLTQAEMNWRAAWAARRALTLTPTDTALAGAAKRALEAHEKRLAGETGIDERIAAWTHLQGKTRSGTDRLPAPERYIGIVLSAGLRDRMGDSQAVEEELSRLYVLSRERYTRPEQDPLWPGTPSRAPRREREHFLEEMRAAFEREATARSLLLSSEKDYLRRAVDHLKDALLAGEMDDDPERALFHAYMIGEFHRRLDELPLADEWFKAVLGLADGAEDLRRFAARQRETVAKQAGNRVNLLAGIGHDGELFEKLRAICHNSTAIENPLHP
ncbi:MAG: hypothetical protein LBJ46_06225 [Planctomycetota bacterium]|jgi:hypothetical protein|nr:hypothetical protein [Planctomycetota bacterium]